MKNILLVVLCTFASLFALQGQSEVLIRPQKSQASPAAKTKTTSLLEKPEHLAAHFVALNLNKLESTETLSITFADQHYRVIPDRSERQSGSHFTWVANNQAGDGQIILSRYRDDIQATITKGTELYRLQTVSPGEYVIIEVDQTAFLPEKCFEAEKARTGEPANNQQQPDPNRLSPFPKKEAEGSKALLPYACKLRLLVLYTPAAKASVSNIQNTINLAIAETNQSFINSGVFQEVELAYAAETAYTEVDIETDLIRFSLPADGFMDEVYELRNTYAADICILFNADTQYCGLASAIQSVPNDAFCLVNTVCATGNYSFGHEIGHLLGCRHDTYVDGQGIPFPYGHGYVNADGGWRTIMAYNTLCSDSGTNCTRVLQWSNPDINFLGQPSGSTLFENCARVWNDNTGITMGFREAVEQKSISSADLLNVNYADLIAKQDISTVGTLSIPPDAEVHLRASQTITLAAGFKAEAGASLHAAIETIYDCGDPPHPNLTSCGNAGNSLTFNGSTLEVTAEVNNSGMSTAGSATVGFFLSPNITISTADYLIGSGNTGNLSPGQSTTVTISLDLNTLSIPDGSYYVGYIVDYLDEVTESNEGDNACYWSSPKVNYPVVLLPDLASCGRAGNDLNIDGNLMYLTADIINSGTVAAGASNIAYYLSTDTEISTADYLIGTDQISGLNPGQSTSASLNLDLNSLSIPDGVYYVGYLLDYLQEVDEVDENNNSCHWTISRVTLPVPALPDLNSCGNEGNTIAINGSIVQATAVVTNNGTAPANPFSVGFYLSTNSIISTGDYLIGSGQVNGLAVGASGAASLTQDLNNVLVPPGEYYIGYVVDHLNEVQEGDEFDNWCYWVNTTISLPLSDLITTGTRSINSVLTRGSNGTVEDTEEQTPSPFPTDSPVFSADPAEPLSDPAAALFSLKAFPNPVDGALNIAFHLPKTTKVTLLIRDVQGRVQSTLLNEHPKNRGWHKFHYDTGALAPGLYFCTIRTAAGQIVQKIVVGK